MAFEFTEELKEALMKTDVSQIGHYINEGYMRPEIKPLWESKMCGPAYTVRYPADGSALLYYAMERAPKGSVIVIDRGGDNYRASVGGIVTAMAKRMGMAGIVIDGYANDLEECKEAGVPVFAKGLSPVTTKMFDMNGSCNVPIQCGGAPVCPGDIIFGDGDGVIVLPPNEEIIRKYINMCMEDYKIEAIWKQAFLEGKTISDFVNITKLVESDNMACLSSLKKVD